MEIYLPIAEQSMNVFVLLGLGGAAGLLAGMFGVGGGFLATPLLGAKVPPTAEKMLPFECGAETTGSRHVKLSVKFYMTAILFAAALPVAWLDATATRPIAAARRELPGRLNRTGSLVGVALLVEVSLPVAG